MLLVWIVIWLLLAVLGLFLLLLLVPTWVRASGWVRSLNAGGDAVAAWGYFVVRLSLSSTSGLKLRVLGIPVYRRTWAELLKATSSERPASTRASALSKDKRSGKHSSERPSRGRLGNWRRILRVLRNAAARLLRTLHFRGWVRGQYGLDDPSDTANIAMVLAAFQRLAPAANVQLDANWMEEVLDVEGEVRLVIWPIQTLVVALMIYLSKDFRIAFNL